MTVIVDVHGEFFMRVKDWYDNRERNNMISLIYEDMVKVSTFT